MLLSEIGYNFKNKVTLNIDNQSAIQLAKNPEFHKRTKHIDTQFFFIREKYESGEMSVEYVSTDQQIADLFTKPLSKDKFEQFRDKICMINF